MQPPPRDDAVEAMPPRTNRQALSTEGPPSDATPTTPSGASDATGPAKGHPTISNMMAFLRDKAATRREEARIDAQERREMLDLLRLTIVGNQQPQQPAPTAVPFSTARKGTPYTTLDGAPRDQDIKLIAPEWEGSKDTLEDFLDQCELNFDAAPAKFPTDQRKILYAIGHMKGFPRTRIRNLRQSNEPVAWMDNWAAFCADLRRVYGDPDPSYTARHRLFQLRQRGPVADHAAEFLSLAAKANATDPGAMMVLFEQSLNDRLRERMAGFCTNDIKEFMNEAIRLEQRLRLIRDTASSHSAPPRRTTGSSSAAAPPKREAEQRSDNRGERPPIPPRDPNRNVAEKIRQHRRANNKCFGCGGNHRVRDCPNAPQTQELRAHALVLDELSGQLLVNPLDKDSDSDVDWAATLSDDPSAEN